MKGLGTLHTRLPAPTPELVMVLPQAASGHFRSLASFSSDAPLAGQAVALAELLTRQDMAKQNARAGSDRHKAKACRAHASTDISESRAKLVRVVWRRT